MPVEKEYRRFGNRYILTNLVTMLPFAVVFGITFWRAWNLIWDFWTFAGIAVFAAACVLGLIWQHYRGTRMRCPQCGELLRIKTRELRNGEPVNFLCAACDVVWVTGLYHGDGDGSARRRRARSARNPQANTEAYEERPLPGVRFTRFIQNAALLGIMVPLLAFIAWQMWRQIWDVWTYAAWLAFAVGVILAATIHHLRMTCGRCAQCGAHLKADLSLLEHGEPITLDCRRCGISWLNGYRKFDADSDGDGGGDSCGVGGD